MKRFFCRVCQRIKRVRRLPGDVVAIRDLDGKVIEYTEGECDYHNRGKATRAEVMGRVRRVSVKQPGKKQFVAPTPSKPSKRKG